MDKIQREHDKIDDLISYMVEHPEELDAQQIRQIAGTLLDLNAYARQLNELLNRANLTIAYLHHVSDTTRPKFSMN